MQEPLLGRGGVWRRLGLVLAVAFGVAVVLFVLGRLALDGLSRYVNPNPPR
jgi:hypothetical protein